MTNQTAFTGSPRTSASMPSAQAPTSETASHASGASARTAASVHLATAGDGERDAGHVLRPAEVDRRVGDLLGRLRTLQIRLALDELLEHPLLGDPVEAGQDRVQHARPHRRLDAARTEGVHRDVL